MAEFTQVSPSIIEQSDKTKSASNLGGPEVTKLQLPDYTSILGTILGDGDAQTMENKKIQEQDPTPVVSATPNQSDSKEVKTAKAEYKPVLKTILNPTPPSGAGKSFEATKQYLMRAAQQRGLDPNVALKVAEHEGLQLGKGGGLKYWQSQYRRGNFQEPSYGPLQLLKGGPGTGFPEGLGNRFQKQTGLDPADPNNIFHGIDFALDYAKQNGWSAWYGAKAAGVSRWQGIRS